MRDSEFANAMIESARKKGLLSPQGHIACSHDKTISRAKLIKIHRLCGDDCANASTEELKKCKIESCCFKVFRMLARLVCIIL